MTEPSAALDVRLAEIRARLTALWSRGPWYVEDARPGREDEARIYDQRGFGVCKPTTDSPHARRPTATFIANAREDIPWLLDTLAAQAADIEHQADVQTFAHDRIKELHTEIDTLTAQLAEVTTERGHLKHAQRLWIVEREELHTEIARLADERPLLMATLRLSKNALAVADADRDAQVREAFFAGYLSGARNCDPLPQAVGPAFAAFCARAAEAKET